MKTITFTCETITPMFLSGADGSTPELRPPSIKGALRFWWRAMNGHLDLKTLKEKEGEIFGDTGRRSGVIVRTRFNQNRLDEKKKLEGSPRNYDEQFKKHYGLEWEKDGYSYSGNDAGITYLFYSCLFSGKRSFIDTGYIFDIILQGYDKASLKKAIASFWLLVQFGGLGTRVRRGAGAFAIKSVADEENILAELDFFGRSDKSFSEYIEGQLSIIIKLFNPEKSEKIKPARYSQFKKKMKIGDSKGKWQEALSEIGSKFKSFREEHEAKIFETPIFGLPIRHSNGITINLQKDNRRSSPLVIQITKYQDKFHWIALWLDGEFMPDGEKVENGKKYKLKNNHQAVSNVSDSLMTTFFTEIETIK